MPAAGRALVTRPRLLLADEMSPGLAPVVTLRLLPILRRPRLAAAQEPRARRDPLQAASGIVHADWLIGAFQVAGENGRPLVFVVPKGEAEVIDNWRVAGLQGTGSLDFRLDGVFVPEEMTYPRGGAAARGGDLFRQEGHLFVDNEVPPPCVGMARRALDDMTELAGHTARFPGAATLSERAVFRKELGRAETRVRAARLVHRDAVAAAWDATRGGGASESQQLAVLTASVYVVETCAEVISDLFRYGGGRVLALSSPVQRQLRNALAARQHVAVTEEHYELAGRERILSAKSRRD